MTGSKGIWRKASVLAVAGGLGFWVATFAISLTPVAAEYRAALSIAYLPMLLESLLGGLIIGFCVSYLLLRFFDRIPTQNPILKSVILSLIVLVIVTILLQSPASFLATGDALRYFLIGTMFNLLRILALGVVTGCLYKRLYTGFNASVFAPESAQVEVSDRRHASSTGTVAESSQGLSRDGSASRS
jgi:NhaP-type Na+/H+ or K+/H+ antiporter